MPPTYRPSSATPVHSDPSHSSFTSASSPSCSLRCSSADASRASATPAEAPGLLRGLGSFQDARPSRASSLSPSPSTPSSTSFLSFPFLIPRRTKASIQCHQPTFGCSPAIGSFSTPSLSASFALTLGSSSHHRCFSARTAILSPPQKNPAPNAVPQPNPLARRPQNSTPSNPGVQWTRSAALRSPLTPAVRSQLFGSLFGYRSGRPPTSPFLQFR